MLRTFHEQNEQIDLQGFKAREKRPQVSARSFICFGGRRGHSLPVKGYGSRALGFGFQGLPRIKDFEAQDIY